MLDIQNKTGNCSICSEESTSTCVEAMPGVKIYVCENCMEAAKHYFIWICMNCGKVYLRPKEMVINRVADYELKRAYLLCRDIQIIQGIDICIECDPEGILNYMNNVKAAKEC